MAYASWSVVFGEQPSASKWNILGTNDATFNTSLTRSGMAVQTVGNVITAVATGTTIIPYDDTIPQITEGTEFLTQAITPIATTNKLIIEAHVFATLSIGGDMAIALFQ